MKVEFYGQGEVQSIANTAEPSRQLALVDNFIRPSLVPRQARVHALISALEEFERQIEDLDIKIAECITELDSLPAVEARIAEIDGEIRASNLEGHQVWEDANSWLEKALEHLERQTTKSQEPKYTDFADRTFTMPDPDAQVALEAIRKGVRATLDLLLAAQVALKMQVAALTLPVMSAKSQWDEKFQAETVRYKEILRKQGVENLNQLNKELAAKRQVKSNSELNTRPRVEKLTRERTRLLGARSQDLDELGKLRAEIRDARQQAADEMTSRLGGTVGVSIAESLNLDSYLETLADCAPHGLYGRNQQLQQIVERIPPAEFATLVRAKDAAQIATRSAVTIGTATKLLDISDEGLMRLERAWRDDIAVVQLVLEEKAKALSDLSQGQKCTAILSVILLDETSPLVVDQPEDELDHEFIMANVVDTLSRLKQKNDWLSKGFMPKSGRQFIIATHNQNIPVLGDAELVLKLRKVPGVDRCEAECARGLEHASTIQHILSLEGGAAAFERRRKRYAAT